MNDVAAVAAAEMEAMFDGGFGRIGFKGRRWIGWIVCVV